MSEAMVSTFLLRKKKKKRLLRFDLGIIGANRDSYRKTSVAISKLPVVQSSSCV